MKRVMIFTLHDANNMGAFLQAYCLQQVLRARGYAVSFGYAPPLQGHQRRLRWALGFVRRGEVGALAFKLRSARHNRALRGLLALEPQPVNEFQRCPIVIVGSDEVWNVRRNNAVPQPVFFGVGLSCERLIAYAACANTTTAADLRALPVPIDFRRFHALSVRDRPTERCVSEFSAGLAPARVLDPTFLLPCAELDGRCPRIGLQRFILVYSYGCTPEEIALAQALSRETGLPLISVGNRLPFCARSVVATPFAFLAYLRAAALVLTSTFHGTALSIKYNKQFWVFAHQNPKVLDLLETFGLQAQNLTDPANRAGWMARRIEYAPVNDMLTALIARSFAFLADALR